MVWTKEERRIYTQEWRKRNPDKVKEYRKRERETEHRKEYVKKYYKKNKGKFMEMERNWGKEKKEKKKEYKKEWKMKNLDKFKEYERKRSEKMKNSPELMKRFKARCQANHKIKIKNGQMCEICKKNKCEDRHHPNYNKPLKIVFVCRKCHKKIHYKELKLHS